jgi:hypothetical protein
MVCLVYQYPQRLATVFERSRGRRAPCLGEITVSEQIPLKALLGLEYRKHMNLPVLSS